MTNIKSTKVFVAMSGGVDSSVAAFLLKKQGYDVTGIYMKNWSDPLANECPWQQDIKDFLKVCQILKIPHQLEIFEDEYRDKIVNYLIKGYQQGITPNPDMLCNREIKFKLFLKKALAAGADYIATGHYVIRKECNGKFLLLQAKDKHKDQSYFLSLLNQQQICHSLFPIGKYLKKEVRQIAKQAGLPVYNKKDSQGICFIGKVKFKDFIRQFIKPRPGLIKTSAGQVIGHHDGLAYYTIGQRHGLDIGGGTPYYIIKKIKKTNSLIVAQGPLDTLLFNNSLLIKNVNWLNGQPPKTPFSCQARIRYGQPLQSCTIYKKTKFIKIKFNKPQRAVTPGQFAVMYSGQTMLGGGVII